VKINLMVSFMPAFAAVKATFILLLAMLSLSGQAAEHFYVDSAIITKLGSGYSLDATLNYPLSPRVIEALENGVPITFLQHFQLTKPFLILGKYPPWHWRETVWSMVATYKLRYHALAEQYILLAVDTRKQRNFPSLDTALNALGKIHAFSLPSGYDIDPTIMTLKIRTELDIYALPTPIRPWALVSNEWQVASPWIAVNWP
jgi:hypothetical protein